MAGARVGRGVSIPSYRARWTRFLLKYSLGRRYRKAGRSIVGLRKLDEVIIRNQRPPKGTQLSPVSVNGFSGEWIQGPGAGSNGAILHLHGGAGVDVDFKVWPGLWHVFQAVARFVPEAQDSIEELGRYVRKCLPEGLAAGENLRAEDS